LRIVIVEEDPEHAAKLEELLARENHTMVATYGSALLLLESVKLAARRNRLDWDLLLMNLGVSEPGAIETMRRLQETVPQMPIVLYTVFETPVSILRTLGTAGLDKTSTQPLRTHLRSLPVPSSSARRSPEPERHRIVGWRLSDKGLHPRLARRKR